MTFTILFLTVTIQNRQDEGKQLEKVVRQQRYETEYKQLVQKLYQ
jgi:hypothetical protein